MRLSTKATAASSASVGSAMSAGPALSAESATSGASAASGSASVRSIVERVVPRAALAARPAGAMDSGSGSVPVPASVPATVTLTVAGDRTAAVARATAWPSAGTRIAGVRMACHDDVEAIHAIVAYWADAGEHLPRPRAEIEARIPDFAVATADGQVAACAALAAYDADLAEIRSVGVAPTLKGSGGGQAVVRHLLAVAALRRHRTVFVLTRVPGFFDRLGFTRTTIGALPQKVRRDCVTCPKIDCCDEIAMVRPVGAQAVLAKQAAQRVQRRLERLGLTRRAAASTARTSEATR